MHILEIIFKSSKASFAIFWFCVDFIYLVNTFYYLNIGFYNQEREIAPGEGTAIFLIAIFISICSLILLFLLNLILFYIFETQYDKFIKIIAKLAVYLFVIPALGGVLLFAGQVFDAPIQRFIISLIPILYAILVIWRVLRKEKK